MPTLGFLVVRCLGCVMLLDLPALSHVNGKLLCEQLEDLLGQLLKLFACVVPASAAAIEKNMALIDVMGR